MDSKDCKVCEARKGSMFCDLQANHLEALDHCPTTRDALRKRIADEGLSSRVHIPSDGEVLHFQRQDAAPQPRPQPFVSRVPGFQKWLTSKLG